MLNNIPNVKLGIIAVSRDCFIIGLSIARREAIKKACKGELYECPVTVENEADMLKAVEDVKAAGGRAIPLKVKGAFHSPFMREAAKAFAEELALTSFRERKITLYSNLTAEPYTASAEGLLSGQICSPVQWEKIIRNMIADGVDTFIEIGPGKTLCNMIRRIDAGVRTANAAEYLAEVETC